MRVGIVRCFQILSYVHLSNLNPVACQFRQLPNGSTKNTIVPALLRALQ